MNAFTASGGETRYILGNVERGTVIATIDASGQVSTSDEVDIKPKASGDITWVGVKAGDTVRAGQALASIDNTDAKQAIADAEADLAQAKLQYQKDSAQAPIDYEETQEALEDAKTDLKNEYIDVYNTISNTYLELPAVVTDAHDVLYGTDLSGTAQSWNVSFFKNAFIGSTSGDDATTINIVTDDATGKYQKARTLYDENLLEYKSLSRYSNETSLETFLDDSVETVTLVAEAVTSELNLIDTYIDIKEQNNHSVPAAVTTLRNDAKSNLSTVNSLLTTILSQQQALETAKRNVRNNERALEIYVIGNSSGNNPISLQSSAQSIANQERNLSELKSALADYTITAPFGGTIASLSLKRFDSVSTGSSVATLITNQKIATLSLNEVDIAKIKLGNKVTLTFDAIEELTLTGEVVEISAVGTVSQGVVSYSVKIAFDTQDERVKPGMTVNASIITEAKQNVLTVPASAVKTQNGMSYVEVFEAPIENPSPQGIVSVNPPTRIEVQIGLSDDVSTEILSGLSEGQQIITRTVTASVATQTNSTSSILPGGGGFRGGGAPTGGVRIQGP